MLSISNNLKQMSKYAPNFLKCKVCLLKKGSVYYQELSTNIFKVNEF